MFHEEAPLSLVCDTRCGATGRVDDRVMRLALAVFLVLLPAAGCVRSPQLGKDEGRAAITWETEPLTLGAAPAVSAATNSERELLAEVRSAETGGGEDLALASALYRLGILRRQQGKFPEAERLYRRALAIRERQQGPNHPDVAVVLNNLAALEAAEGDEAAAQPLLERALTIRQTAFGDEHVLTAQSLNNLALLYAAQGNTAAAEPLYQHALAILEKAPSAELKRVLDNYAALLRDNGRDTEAEALEARARVMRAADPALQPGP